MIRFRHRLAIRLGPRLIALSLKWRGLPVDTSNMLAKADALAKSARD